MGKFEQQAIDNALLIKPIIWWRFIDDIFMIWTHGEEHLKTFKFTHEYFNSLHQTLPFPDVQVHLITNHGIQTDLHTKPTDKRQYVPNHTKKAIQFSLFLLIRCICSTDTSFDQRSQEAHRVPYQTWPHLTTERCESRSLNSMSRNPSTARRKIRQD